VIYFLQGTENFLFDQELAMIAKKAQISKDEIVHYSANETEFSTLVLETNSDDLFGKNKIIVLKDLEQQKISQYLVGINEELERLLYESQNILVIHFWREDPLNKTLQQQLSPILKQAIVIDTKKKKERDVVQSIKKAFAKRKHTLSDHELRTIAQKYQNNLSLIHKEIDRIVLAKDETVAITADDFKTDTQFLEEQVFDLIEVLERKEVDEVVYLLDNVLLHQQNVFGLLALLLKNYKEMYQIQTLSKAGYTLAQVTTHLNLHPYRAKLLFAKATILNDFQYQFILHKIITTEIDLKTGKQQALALRELLLQIINIQM